MTRSSWRTRAFLFLAVSCSAAPPGTGETVAANTSIVSFTHLTVLAMDGTPPASGQTVLVARDRITAVGPWYGAVFLERCDRCEAFRDRGDVPVT